MNTVIKGTKTIAEYKRVREDMENLARANYARHKEAFEEWREGEPIKAWFDFEGNFCMNVFMQTFFTGTLQVTVSKKQC